MVVNYGLTGRKSALLDIRNWAVMFAPSLHCSHMQDVTGSLQVLLAFLSMRYCRFTSLVSVLFSYNKVDWWIKHWNPFLETVVTVTVKFVTVEGARKVFRAVGIEARFFLKECVGRPSSKTGKMYPRLVEHAKLPFSLTKFWRGTNLFGNRAVEVSVGFLTYSDWRRSNLDWSFFFHFHILWSLMSRRPRAEYTFPFKLGDKSFPIRTSSGLRFVSLFAVEGSEWIYWPQCPFEGHPL